MSIPHATANIARLVPIAGPPLRPIELRSTAGQLTIGRQDGCDVRLPNDAVSRVHARLRFEDDMWRLADAGSRWGTFLNGCRMLPDTDLPLRGGDLIRISPWTFTFSAGLARGRTVQSRDDREQLHTLVRSSNLEQNAGFAEDRLALILEAAAALHAAADERELAEATLAAACNGSGLSNAAILRAVDDAGQVEVVASRHAGATAQVTFSRSLIAAASSGQVAEFPPDHAASGSQSIVQFKVDAAICVPLMLGPSPAAYLYLDVRGGRGGEALSSQRWNAAVAFSVALGRVASLALANLKRLDIERRAAMIDLELRAASEAQRWILPRRRIAVASVEGYGESRAGRFVGGDFFDVVPLDQGCLALALGDVSGKGVPASVLMSGAHGFLHATLLQNCEVAAAVERLNRFVAPRRPGDRFITLWAGVIDPVRRLLHYVDAGHGYALLFTDDHPPQPLNGGDNLPLGVSEDAEYAACTLPLPTHGHLLVVSDGFIEQTSPSIDGAPRAEFGIEGVRAAASTLLTTEDPVTALFDAVKAHASADVLADDATALIARW